MHMRFRIFIITTHIYIPSSAECRYIVFWYKNQAGIKPEIDTIHGSLKAIHERLVEHIPRWWWWWNTAETTHREMIIEKEKPISNKQWQVLISAISEVEADRWICNVMCVV